MGRTSKDKRDIYYRKVLSNPGALPCLLATSSGMHAHQTPACLLGMLVCRPRRRGGVHGARSSCCRLMMPSTYSLVRAWPCIENKCRRDEWAAVTLLGLVAAVPLTWRSFVCAAARLLPPPPHMQACAM